MPTTLEVGRAFKINDTPVPAGKYSLWIVARPNDDWSLRIEPRSDLQHFDDPDSSATQYHTHLKVMTIDPVETLTWSITSVQRYRATVRMAWGNRAAEFTLALKPSVSVGVDPAVAARITSLDSLLTFHLLGLEALGGDSPGMAMALVPRYPSDRLWIAGTKKTAAPRTP